MELEMSKLERRIDYQIEWEVVRTQEENWVAQSPALGLVVEAQTWDELTENIQEMQEILFQDLLKSNELATFLQKKGWTLIGSMPKPTEEVQFEIPYLALAASAGVGAGSVPVPA